MNADQMASSGKLRQWRAENAIAPKAPAANNTSIGPKAQLPNTPLCRLSRNKDIVQRGNTQTVRSIEGNALRASFQ